MLSRTKIAFFHTVSMALFVSATAALLGCDECRTSKDCSGGQICVSGKCTSTMATNDSDSDTGTGGYVLDSDTGPDQINKDAGPTDTDSETDTGAIGGPCADSDDCADDGNPCTSVRCISEVCNYIKKSNSPCEFGDDPCTVGACQDGVCVGKTMPDGMDCDDGFWCNGFQKCQSGICVSLPETIPCTLGDPCRRRSCTEPAVAGQEGTCTGEGINEPDGTSCDNGLFCDGVNTCLSGVCTSKASCGDLESGPCNERHCDEEKDECVLSYADMQGVSCADTDPCDGEEHCRDGACRPGIPACDLNNTCETRGCSVASGKPVCDSTTVISPNGSSCTPNASCAGTGDNYCLEGICSYGSTGPCDLCNDGNFCSYYIRCDEGTAGAQCIGDVTSCAGGMFVLNEGDTDEVSVPIYPFSAPGLEVDKLQTFNTTLTYNEVSAYDTNNCPGSFTGGEQIFKVVAGAGDYFADIAVYAATGAPEEMRLLLITDAEHPAATGACVAHSEMDTDTEYSATVNWIHFSRSSDTDEQYIVVDGLNGCRARGSVALFPNTK